jgi:hypothetical protein
MSEQDKAHTKSDLNIAVVEHLETSGESERFDPEPDRAKEWEGQVTRRVPNPVLAPDAIVTDEPSAEIIVDSGEGAVMGAIHDDITVPRRLTPSELGKAVDGDGLKPLQALEAIARRGRRRKK